MRYLLLLVVLLAACTSVPASPSIPARSLPLTGTTVFDTGPFDCDRQSLQWTWEAPVDTYIYQASAWQGMDMGAIADFSVVLVRRSDSSELFRHNWDHYTDPAGNNDQIVLRDLTPNYMLVAAGDALVLNSVCLPYPGPTHGHIIVTIWYWRPQ